MTGPGRTESGFSLVAVLFMLLLVLSLSVYLSLLMANESNLTSSLDSQLYSLILAENGVEYARSLLPHLDLNQLLAGPDGKHAGTSAREWRNPLSFDLARTMDPITWSPAGDDGWPAHGGNLLLQKGYAAAGEGRFYIRFSNNPSEPADKDTDGIVLVRSMGVTKANRTGLFPSSKNNVSLVEAVLRQERVFDLQAALVLFGETGKFEWPTEGFEFDGGQLHPAVATLGGKHLLKHFLNSLSTDQNLCFRGVDDTPSVQDTTLSYITSPIFCRVFDSRFWQHFKGQLPAFADKGPPGLLYYPTGGLVTGSLQGILVGCGDLTVTGASVEGLLLHLGNGRLILGPDTSLRGGIWMSNHAGEAEGKMVHQPLDLKLFGSVSVIYDSGAVGRALTLLPPTQLGWRILFPEMKL
jgi:hypothetical protein